MTSRDAELPPEVTPPPLYGLKRRMGPIAKVRTRRPGIAFAVAALASLLWGALAFAVHPLRGDLPWLPMAWLVPVAAVWALGFAWALSRAIVPPRGQVLPDGRAAERIALLILVALTALTALGTVDAPGHSKVPENFVVVTWHCLRFSLLVGAGVLLITLGALRRLRAHASWRLGLAIGAAGGALGGLSLHFLCAYATAAHVTAGHAGGVAGGALVGALAARLWFGRSDGVR